MSLWFEILALLLLALIVLQLFGIEGSIHLIAEAIDELKDAAFPPRLSETQLMERIKRDNERI